jgi:hypothetical protein
MFEDLEAQASFRPSGENTISKLLAESRSARIGWVAEGIVVKNLVFGKDFLLSLGAQSIFVFPIPAIERLELRSAGGHVSRRTGLRMRDWLNRYGTSFQITLSFLHSPESITARFVDCDADWLLIETHEDMKQILVGLKSVGLMELVPVDNLGESGWPH